MKRYFIIITYSITINISERGMEMDYKATSYRITDFINWYKNRELILNPKFQRRRVWQLQGKVYLIDTILKDLPMPKVFLREIIDLDKEITVREVVDGQQRLQTIFEFYKNKFPVSRKYDEELGGKKFKDLDSERKRAFLHYEISVDVLTGASDTDVLDMFKRINSYTKTLNAQEKLNAEFVGYFKETVYKTARKHYLFWTENKILTDTQLARMIDAELTSELFVSMMAGLQDKKKSIKAFYKKYDPEFPGRRKFGIRFDSIIDIIGELFQNRLKTTIYHRKAIFYSLFNVFYDGYYGLPKSNRKRFKITRTHIEPVYAALENLGLQVKKTEPPKKYLDFVKACARQTDNIKPRETRHRYIYNVIRNAMK